MSTITDTAASAAAVTTAVSAADAANPVPADQPRQPRHAQQEPAPEGVDQSTPGQRPQRVVRRPSRVASEEDIDELLSGDESELMDRLASQLQGLSFKQQEMYGIWNPEDPEAGRRTFLEQWRQRHADRRAMVAGLADPAVPPQERMALRASYIHRWRKILFSCPTCWLLPGLCVCGRLQRFATQHTKVVIHAHHGEWGSASNSGAILGPCLEGTEVLLYNYPDHDTRLRELLADPTRTTALLWPGADSLLPSELSAIARERTGGCVTVVALDATWSNARRMQGWFPRGTLTVKLPAESTLKENKLSLLRPVRRYRGDLESGRVSTVEAVASLLLELEGDEALYRGLLDNLKIKVDACRLQKNRTLVYDTQEPQGPSNRSKWRERQAQARAAAEAGAAEAAGDGVEAAAAAAAEAGAAPSTAQAAGGSV
ncbi:hypothetical protein HYH03_010131 [Edaphochlamys debaryana]|uniref:tRNA-uridine aminocarboxypropyltransferase n=1 Tax=Edaphochlamys debaryana TaxID=47281 RepID=A0A836BX13_9CHLO|nr:hypothetical protein HYH03_010131 [Edaphochlamys debaryana]|eukprot:KAG2491562.1 hypothetical protein HYH03_010131 [Edaphochlamys debaryana]